MLRVESPTEPRLCDLCEETEATYVLVRGESQPQAVSGVCQFCVDERVDKRGKFENNHDMPAALMLYNLSSLSYYDESLFNDGWGFLCIIDNWLLTEDTQGFVTVEEFKSDEQAQSEYDRYHDNGWGAQEDDIYVTHDYYRGIEVYQNGKKIPVWPDKKGEISERRIDAAINLHMSKTGFFPNVWNQDERGSTTLRKIRVVNI